MSIHPGSYLQYYVGKLNQRILPQGTTDFGGLIYNARCFTVFKLSILAHELQMHIICIVYLNAHHKVKYLNTRFIRGRKVEPI